MVVPRHAGGGGAVGSYHGAIAGRLVSASEMFCGRRAGSPCPFVCCCRHREARDEELFLLQEDTAAKPAPHSREGLADMDSAFDPAAAAVAAAKAQVRAARCGAAQG